MDTAATQAGTSACKACAGSHRPHTCSGGQGNAFFGQEIGQRKAAAQRLLPVGGAARGARPGPKPSRAETPGAAGTGGGEQGEEEEEAEAYRVEKILDSQSKGKRRRYLVKWVGYSEAEATWEPSSNCDGCEAMIAAFGVPPLGSDPQSQILLLPHPADVPCLRFGPRRPEISAVPIAAAAPSAGQSSKRLAAEAALRRR